jgi:hypothetical protein
LPEPWRIETSTFWTAESASDALPQTPAVAQPAAQPVAL